MSYLKQYFRDLKYLFKDKKRNKLKLFLIYNRLCLKNIFFTKLFKIKSNKENILGYTVFYDNFNSFFAMFTEIFLHNIYGHIELNKKNPVIIDCGANIGIATIYFKYIYPSAKILSFEPDPLTFNILKKNCEINKFKNVDLYNAALSDKKGKLKFYSYGAFEGSPGNTIHKKWVNFNNVKEFEVDCMPLSSLIFKNIDLLKIDVEGAEGKIIDDLNKNNKFQLIKNINLEYHYGTASKDNSFGMICSILEKNNFDFVINPDSLIDDAIDIKKFIKTRNYVAIMNCVKIKIY